MHNEGKSAFPNERRKVKIFYLMTNLQLCGMRDMVQDQPDSHYTGYSFRSAARDSTYHRLCYTSQGPVAGMTNSWMGLIRRPVTPWEDDLPSYRSTVSKSFINVSLNRNVSNSTHDWVNKGCGMCYPVCGMMLIEEPLLLIGKSSLYGSSRFPLSLSEWSFTIKYHITVNKMCWVHR